MLGALPIPIFQQFCFSSSGSVAEYCRLEADAMGSQTSTEILEALPDGKLPRKLFLAMLLFLLFLLLLSLSRPLALFSLLVSFFNFWSAFPPSILAGSVRQSASWFVCFATCLVLLYVAYLMEESSQSIMEASMHSDMHHTGKLNMYHYLYISAKKTDERRNLPERGWRQNMP